MTFAATTRMEWFLQRCHKEALSHSALRSVLFMSLMLLVLSVSLYPGLWSIGVRLHSALTGSYVPGHHSVLLINSPNEQAAKDIGRAIMERRLAASVNILCRTSTMYYWKGEIQDASEILMVSVLRMSSSDRHVLTRPVEMDVRTVNGDVAVVVAAGENKDLQDPAGHRLREVCASLCKPRSP